VERESPGDGVVLGGSSSRRALIGLEEHRSQLQGVINELDLIGVGVTGVEDPLEGEIDGEGRRVGEVEEDLKESQSRRL
ncbi:hypothetical protein QQS19_33920, partial [Pseudomonas aeruginosa]|uniref:hypothetical protein n=1 Tax=Pseudomonas aeruginosa TaxID=287 RepID=UPI002B23A50A